MMKMFIAALGLVGIFASPAFAEQCEYERQVEVLALNIYHEARGEPLDGQQMVAEVTLNRVEHDSYPDTICEVVYQPYQFSWVHLRRNHTPEEEEAWERSLLLAEQVLNEEIELFDNGATHFLDPSALDTLPSWAHQFDVVGQIGSHVFYEM